MKTGRHAGPAWMRLILHATLLLLLLGAGHAWAHKPSDSYLTLAVADTTAWPKSANGGGGAH